MSTAEACDGRYDVQGGQEEEEEQEQIQKQDIAQLPIMPQQYESEGFTSKLMRSVVGNLRENMLQSIEELTNCNENNTERQLRSIFVAEQDIVNSEEEEEEEYELEKAEVDQMLKTLQQFNVLSFSEPQDKYADEKILEQQSSKRQNTLQDTALQLQQDARAILILDEQIKRSRQAILSFTQKENFFSRVHRQKSPIQRRRCYSNEDREGDEEEQDKPSQNRYSFVPCQPYEVKRCKSQLQVQQQPSDQTSNIQKEFLPKDNQDDQNSIEEEVVASVSPQKAQDSAEEGNIPEEIEESMQQDEPVAIEQSLKCSRKAGAARVIKRQFSACAPLKNDQLKVNLQVQGNSNSAVKAVASEAVFEESQSCSVNLPKTVVPSAPQNQLQKANLQQQQQAVSTVNAPAKNVLRQGILKKHSQGLLGSYDKRFFVLTAQKLYYYKEKGAKTMRGCINFKVTKCRITNIRGKKFTINITDYNRQWELKGLTLSDARDWIDDIQTSIAMQCDSAKMFIKSSNIERYFNNDTISESDFVREAETGDLLLFETDNFAAMMQRKLTGSKYDHVGLCIKFDDNDLRVFDSQVRTGVTLMDWKEFITYNDLYTKVALRKLVCERRYMIVPQIFEFVGESIGQKYKLSFTKLLKRESISDTGMGRRQKRDGYFCSELVAKAYKNIGLLPQKKSACAYWPADFQESTDLQLLNGASLSNETIVVLERHLNYKYYE